MQICRTAFIGTVLVASFLGAAEPAIQLAGVLTAGGKTRVALTDTTTKTTTWVETGGQFNGYTVARYDANEDAVFLEKSGQETRLALVSAKSSDHGRSSSAASSGTAATSATAIRANLRLLASAARKFLLAQGVTTVGASDLIGPEKLIKELKPIAGEDYSTLSFGANVTDVSLTTANGATVSLDLLSVAAPAPAATPRATP